MSEWTEFRDKVESFFVSESQVVIDFLKPFASTIEAEGKQILISAATNAVSVGEAAPGTGLVKMEAALAAFSATIIAQGLPYIESEARALIEVALQNFKLILSPVGEPALVEAPAA